MEENRLGKEKYLIFIIILQNTRDIIFRTSLKNC